MDEGCQRREYDDTRLSISSDSLGWRTLLSLRQGHARFHDAGADIRGHIRERFGAPGGKRIPASSKSEGTPATRERACRVILA